MNDIRAVLYDTEWQFLRIRLKKSWKTYDECVHNLSVLQVYVDRAAAGSMERYFRLLRVINLLNALRMGLSGMGRMDSAESMLIEMVRLPLQDERDELAKSFPVSTLPEWDWEKQRVDLTKLCQADPVTYQRLLADLQGRAEKHGIAYRQELARYVELMREVLRKL